MRARAEMPCQQHKLDPGTRTLHEEANTVPEGIRMRMQPKSLECKEN